MSYTPLPVGAILTSGTAWSHRDGINVVYSGKDNRLNWKFDRTRGPVIEAVRANVRAVIQEDAPGWLARYPEYSVSVRSDPTKTGAYDYTVYNETSEISKEN